MKKAIILFLCLTTIKVSVAQWTAIDSGRINAVWLVQPNDGWSFGENFKHWDGTNWTTVIQDSAFGAQTCAFTAPDEGWVFGNQDSLFRYNGSVWTKYYSGRSNIQFCDFFDSNNGWLLGSDTTYNYKNGNWTIYPLNLPAFIPWCIFNSISASDSSTAWMTGIKYDNSNIDTSYIFKFSSGQWTIDTALGNVNLYTICFSDQNHGWAGGLNSGGFSRVIYKYDGAGWQLEYSSPSVDMLSGGSTIYMLNNSIGWFSDCTFDIYGYNGLAWSYLDSLPNYLIKQFSFVDPLNGLALGIPIGHPGPPDMIYQTTNGGLGYEADQAYNSAEICIFPNPATDKISVLCDHRQNFSLSVYNVVGALVLKRERFDIKEEIDINFLPAGVYMIKATSSDWTVIKKIIKE